MPDRLFAAPGWLVGAVPNGVVLVGPSAEIDIAFEATSDERRRLVDLLADGTEPRELALALGAGEEEAVSLFEHLREQGALRPEPPPPMPAVGTPLARAVLDVGGGGPLPQVSFTAEEALVVPNVLHSEWTRRNALRRFVAGLGSPRRLAAYATVARDGVEGVRGDAPAADLLMDALEAAGAQPEAVHVLDLRHGTRASVGARELDSLGAERPHRLGPVLEAVEQSETGRGSFVFVARYAAPSLKEPGGEERWGRGSAATRERAELVARAEAVERYAAGEVSRVPLVRAAENELAGAVDPAELMCLSPRQYRSSANVEPHDSGEPLLWTPAFTRDGARRWVPAEAVLYPFEDPERARAVAPTTSSGMAAHTDFAEARTRALCELVERDAFYWTWVQRVSRERIGLGSLPPELGPALAAARSGGAEVTLVNLTLDTHPVLLAVLHAGGLVSLGAACHGDPRTAAAKALEEATSVAQAVGGARHVEPREVSSPEEHLIAHRPEAMRPEHEFLYSSRVEIALDEVTAASDPIEDSVRAVGEPLVVDLSSAATRPFVVVRAVVPGLIPITFGFDREPLGMPRLAEPKTTRDGRVLGRRLDLTETAPLVPHPFP